MTDQHEPPAPQQFGPARIRITGLVVSPRHSGRLLGYDRFPHEDPG